MADYLKDLAMGNLALGSSPELPTLQKFESVSNDTPPSLNSGRTMMLNTIMKDLLSNESRGDKDAGLLDPLITAQKIKVATQFQQQEQEVQNKRSTYAQGIFREAKAIIEDNTKSIPEKQMAITALGMKAEGNGFPEINKTFGNITTTLNKELDTQNKQNQFVAKLTADYSTTDDAKKFLQENGVPISAFFSTTTNPITGLPMVSKKEVMGIYNKYIAEKFDYDKYNQQHAAKVNAQVVLTKMRGIDSIERTIEGFKLKNEPTLEDMKSWITQLVSQGQSLQEAFGFIAQGRKGGGFMGFGQYDLTPETLFTSEELAIIRGYEVHQDNVNFRQLRSLFPKTNVYQLGGTPAISAPLQEPSKPIITTPNKTLGQAQAAPVVKITDRQKFIQGVIKKGYSQKEAEELANKKGLK